MLVFQTRTVRLLLRVCLLLAGIGISSEVCYACCYSAQGQISQVQLIASPAGAPGAQDFRVILVGNVPICGTNTWAYINSTDANYAASVAALLSAKLSGSTVQLNSSPDSAGNCQIYYFTLL